MESSFDLMDAPVCIALGTFDGVHRAHKMILERLIEESKKRRTEAFALIFSDDFFQIIQKNVAIISTEEEKRSLMQKIGVKCLTLPTNENFLRYTGKGFWDWLTGALNVRCIVVGEDYTFGSDRVTAEALSYFGKQKGIDVLTFPLEHDQAGKISSSRVREAIAEGDMKKANALMGHPLLMIGKVIHGRGEGKLFGFPTANLQRDRRAILPQYGVYAAHASVDGELFPAVVNVGTQPTFGGTTVTIEAMIGEEFNRDLYGKRIGLHFLRKIREIQKFESAAALREQIEKDLAEVHL